MTKRSLLLPFLPFAVLLACTDEPLDTARHGSVEVQAPFEFEVASVDVTVSDADAVVTAYDDAGESVGTLAFWVDDAGLAWIVADFPDGYSLTRMDLVTEAVEIEGNLPADLVTERVEQLSIYLDDPAEPQAKGGGKEKPKHSWLECGGYVAIAGFTCHKLPLNPLGCIGSAGKAACACIPKVVKEFEVYKCPVIG